MNVQQCMNVKNHNHHAIIFILAIQLFGLNFPRVISSLVENEK
jgi:hypothetical protein